MPSARRLVSFATVLGFAAAGSLLATPPVVADTGDITYTCTIPSYGTQDIDIALSTDAPAEMVVGESFDPTLTVKVIIPASVIGLAKLFGYTHASATGQIGVGVNGSSATLPATYPRTQIPASGDFVVDIPIALPELKPTRAGVFRYTPGPIAATLSVFQGADDQTAESIQADCEVKDPSPDLVIDTVNVSELGSPPSKAASTTRVVAPATTYGKAGKATVTVAADGVPVTGSVTLSGAGATQTKPVSGGKAVFTLGKRLLAKTYTLKATYTGSGAVSGSTKRISFTVRKAAVAGTGFALNLKPTSKQSGRATVVVRAPEGLRTPTGTVRVVLTKGSLTRTITVTLASGRKAFVLPKLPRGTWSVAVRYAGDVTYKAATRRTSFTVTR